MAVLIWILEPMALQDGMEDDMNYTTRKKIVHVSRYGGKTVTVPKGYVTDGASGAIDIRSDSWIVHDWICGNYLGSGPKPEGGQFDDGTPMNNRQASTILSDILMEEGRWLRRIYWWPMTWLFGGGKARENGMWK